MQQYNAKVIQTEMSLVFLHSQAKGNKLTFCVFKTKYKIEGEEKRGRNGNVQIVKGILA